MRSFGKPKISDDWSVIEYIKRPKDWEPPPPIEGYERDPSNGWRFTRLWPECKDRKQGHIIKSCGRLILMTFCKCADCPLANKLVKLADCRACEHRQ